MLAIKNLGDLPEWHFTRFEVIAQSPKIEESYLPFDLIINGGVFIDGDDYSGWKCRIWRKNVIPNFLFLNSRLVDRALNSS